MPRTDFSQLDDAGRAELWAALALCELKGLGATARAKLVGHFGSPYEAVKNVRAWNGIGVKDEVSRHYDSGLWRGPARKKWDIVRDSGENILLYGDEAYPELLREIPDPPLFIFYRGDISLLSNPAVGVVGARNCSREGMSVAVDIVRGLSRAGVTTISGMARGIDRVAHLAGLEGTGGSIAVLGCGVNVPYPKANLDLYDLMQKKGLIISEFLPGSEPKQYNFPVRNRIISGLSRAVLVVEAAVRSGTLITARHAVEQGRDVFAVPGSTVADASEGCRDLIRRGARAVFTAEDILLELAPVLRGDVDEKLGRKSGASAAKALDSLGILPWDSDNPDADARQAGAAKNAEAPNAIDIKQLCSQVSACEADILNMLNQRPNCHIDIICDALMLDVSQVSRALTMLEVKGLVKRLPGMYYNISL